MAEAEKRTIPSKVDDRYWVWPKKSEEEGYERRCDPNGGKWMAFITRTHPDRDGLTLLDRQWYKIEEKVNSGELYHAKASTAMLTPHCRQDSQCGVIIFYTKDFQDKVEVKETARTIRKILGESFKGDLLYKTNPATDARLYPSLNIKGVSLYKHLINDSFWERVGGKWQLVKDDFRPPPGLEDDYSD